MRNVMIQNTKEYRAGEIEIRKNPANDKWQFDFNGRRSFNTLKEVKAFLINKGVEEKVVKTSAPVSKNEPESEEEKSDEEIFEEIKKENKITDLREQSYRCAGVTSIPGDSQMHLLFVRYRQGFIDKAVV